VFNAEGLEYVRVATVALRELKDTSRMRDCERGLSRSFLGRPVPAHHRSGACLKRIGSVTYTNRPATLSKGRFPMYVDRRAFLASVGGSAVLASMPSSAKADALEAYLHARLNEVLGPPSPAGAAAKYPTVA
jgi:hypothetical protein